MVAAAAPDPTQGKESRPAVEQLVEAGMCRLEAAQPQSISMDVGESDAKCESVNTQIRQQAEDITLDVPTPSWTQAPKRRWLDSSYTGPENKLFKSEMCWYAAGCRHGASCLFAHTEDELRVPPKVPAPQPTPPTERWKPDLAGDYSWKRKELCTFFQKGCCSYDEYTCFFRHDAPPEERCLKTMLCKDFLQSATCSRDNCTDAHGQHELRTPEGFVGAPGYKTCLCTFFLLDELTCHEINCFDAHGDCRQIESACLAQLAAALAWPCWFGLRGVDLQ